MLLSFKYDDSLYQIHIDLYFSKFTIIIIIIILLLKFYRTCMNTCTLKRDCPEGDFPRNREKKKKQSSSILLQDHL